MARKKWDAIVVGAGPAGASAARTLVAGGVGLPVDREEEASPTQDVLGHPVQLGR